MYKIDDIVLHPSAGVCKVEDIENKTFPGKGLVQYYKLRPVYNNDTMTIFIPVDSTQILLRKLLNKDDIYNLIHSIDSSESIWIENNALRKKSFNEILKSGDHRRLIQMIAELHLKQIEVVESGRKFHATDESILLEAEKMIHQEFATVLGLTVDEIAPFIMEELRVKA